MSLEGHQLALARGDRTLFAGLDLAVDAGEALWVAGPNGSGKTSLLRLLAGLARPQHGEVRWHGTPITEQRGRYHAALLWVGHATGSPDDLTPVEHLRHAARLRGQACSERDAEQALERFGLGAASRRPARTLSQGQRKRVGLARLALQPAPALALLDEPFSALDTSAIQQLTDVLDGLLAGGSRVVYTTHQPQPLNAPGGVRELSLGALSPCGSGFSRDGLAARHASRLKPLPQHTGAVS